MPTQSVDRAIAVLGAFSVEEPVLGVTELSQRLGLHKSTVHRLLASLEQGGLVERDARSRRYRLGTRLIEFGNTVVGSWRLPQLVLPYLRYLADNVEEMSYLGVPSGHATVTVLQVPSPHLVQAVTWIPRSPLHCTSAGKIFLAHMPEEELDALLAEGLSPVSANTICDPAVLRQELERVRAQGFGTAFGEYEEGQNAIAAPITQPDDRVIGAIGVVGPSYRFTREKVLKAADMTKSLARTVSRELRAPRFRSVE